MKLPSKIRINNLFQFLIIFLFFSCQSKEVKLDRNLKQTFKNDSLKIKYASYLLKDIHERFHFTGEHYDDVSNLISNHLLKADSLQKIVGQLNFQIQSDVIGIEPKYLINNIENTCNCVNRANWTRSYDATFIQKYILPYRFNSACPEYWRDSIMKDFGDTVFQYKNVKNATLYLVDRVTNALNDFHLKSKIILPDLGYSTLKKLPYGSCKELCEYMQYICSTFAIPCVHDFSPSYTNLRASHHWNALIDPLGKITPFVVPAHVDTLGRFKSETYKLGKVYRLNFESNKSSFSYLYGKKEYLPAFFSNKYIFDVTADYINVSDVTIPIGNVETSDSVFYLCVCDNIWWYPITWGTLGNNKTTALFKNIGVESVYLPFEINENSKQPLGFPFILQNNGEIKSLHPRKDSLITLQLTRKFPLTKRIKSFINKMNGGYFEVSNDSTFENSTIILKVNNLNSELVQKRQVNMQKSYKYVRFMGPPGSFCTVAELHFMDINNHEIKGRIISSRQVHPLTKDRIEDKAFDGDVLSFFYADSADHSWIGLEFESPQKVKEIDFLPRNGNNVIEPGNLYEVFYWEDRWISLGQKVASSNVLKYDNVPSNALYFIKNLTKGKQERIFTMKDEKQIWW